MCPKLKERLLVLGKNRSSEEKDVNNLMIHIDDEDYSNWSYIEDHLSLEMLNGILL